MMNTLPILLFFTILNTTLFAQLSEESPKVNVVPKEPSEAEMKKVITEETIYDLPDVEAQFNGGSKALQNYIAKNFKYPKKALKKNVQGRVYVSFVVEIDGSISNIHIDKGQHPSLDKEVIRLVKEMPKWKPGMANGKIVRTLCRMPVNCVIN